MHDHKLIPYPRILTETGGYFCGDLGDPFAACFDGGNEHISFVADASLGAEEYTLCVHTDGAVVSASGEKGRVNGAATLAQLKRQYGKKLPCLTVRDSPRMPIRMVQICLGQVNAELRREWFARFVRKMAKLKITHIGLYFEWNFRFPSVPELCNPSYPNKDDMLFAQSEAHKYGIEIVPEFALMGHSQDLLELEAFADLRERPEKDDRIADAYYDSLCFTSPKVRQFVQGVLNDICDIFTGPIVHIGGDEVGRIGECASCSARARDVGKMGLYLDHLEFVSDILAQRGKKTGVWGDMLLMLSDNSPFWEGKDLELEYRAAAVERLKNLKDRIVIFDWWYAGVNKASVDFFRGLGLYTVACTSTNGCYVSAVNINQLENAKLLCDYAAQKECAGVMMCDWINYLGDHAEQQYPFYAAVSALGWSGCTSPVSVPSDGFLEAVSLQLYGVRDGALIDFWHFCGDFDSPLLSFYPEAERGLALRKYVFQNDDPLAFYLCLSHRLCGDNARRYGEEIKKLEAKAAALRFDLDDPYARFALLPVLLHKTLYESFGIVQDAQREYKQAAQMQYRDPKGCKAALMTCADILGRLDNVYARVVQYAENEYKRLGNDKAALVRLSALRQNLCKLTGFVRSLSDGHRPLPSFKNISGNLFSPPKCSEWNARELDWAAEKAEYRQYCVDNGKSWFCRPFDCYENH